MVETEYLNIDQFNKCLDDFVCVVYRHQGKGKKLSFSSGYIKDQESYKQQVFEEANNSRQKLENGGQGELIDWLFGTLKIKGNNLIYWQNSKLRNLMEKSPEIREKSESLLYRIYNESDDEQLFNEAVELWGNQYPLISYIFFLKNKKEYLPVRPEKFSERFEQLRIPDDCLKKCTWENYQIFIKIITEVQQALINSKIFSGKIERIDAHSFVWMLWELDESGDLENYERDSEGRQVKFYGTEYERSAKNRGRAIELNQDEEGYHYYCKICGFNFEKEYGVQFIEVHHKEPLWVRGGNPKPVNPETDLICLCPNCHRMVHRLNIPDRPEELLSFFKKK